VPPGFPVSLAPAAAFLPLRASFATPRALNSALLMTLTAQQVLHVAGLARLELTPQEAAQLGQDLSRILEHIEQLNTVDTTGVAPTCHVGVQATPLRPDEAQAGVETDLALRGAPRTAAGGFAVPAFVEE
jgi:aspartyl-tRNA(Asn)/glutamyl-tRNA(Gln) amidotransferase subunit C